MDMYDTRFDVLRYTNGVGVGGDNHCTKLVSSVFVMLGKYG
jgi:hypothetical protein